jgi:hypothetical protein
MGEASQGLQVEQVAVEEQHVKLLLHPGGALFVLAAFALLVWLVAPSLPIVGGLIKFMAFVTIVFGVVGGVFLTFMVNKSQASN